MKNIHKIRWNKKLKLSEWGQARQKMEGLGDMNIVRIGASDISVCAGSNTYKCPQRLFYHLTGKHSSFFMTPSSVAGHLEEPNIVRHFEGYVADNQQEYLANVSDAVRLRKLQKANYFLTNDKYPNGFISLDYTPLGKVYSPITGQLYPSGMPVELKTAQGFYYKLWVDGITNAYYDQIQWQMLLTEQPMALMLVYVDKEILKLKEIEANPERQQFILEKVNEFADKVRIGKMALQGMKDAEASGNIEEYEAFHSIFEQVTPEPIGTNDNVELVQEIYDKAIDEDINTKKGDEQDEIWMNQYLRCIRAEKVVEANKNLAKVNILHSCGNYEGIVAGERKLINRRPTATKKAYFKIS